MFRNPFRPTVKAYWWKEIPNFGDGLAALILEHFTSFKTQWAPMARANFVSVGSVLEHVPPLWDGYILGSGRLHENSRTHIVQMKSGVTAKILALRGPLTAKGIPGTYALGDPGLLSDELVGPQPKLWDLGILPHWQDLQLVPRFKQMIKAPSTVKCIYPHQDPRTVLRLIGSCKRVVTSSLHGAIVADAFGIPRRIEECPAMLRDGGNFKFRDYSESIRLDFKTGVMQEPTRFRVEDVKFALYDAYKAFNATGGRW